jgi:hypothetical protein
MLKCLGRDQKPVCTSPYIEISPHWELKFHVQTYASQLQVGAILV